MSAFFRGILAVFSPNSPNFGPIRPKKPRKPPTNRRLHLEPLEERTMLCASLCPQPDLLRFLDSPLVQTAPVPTAQQESALLPYQGTSTAPGSSGLPGATHKKTWGFSCLENYPMDLCGGVCTTATIEADRSLYTESDGAIPLDVTLKLQGSAYGYFEEWQALANPQANAWFYLRFEVSQYRGGELIGTNTLFYDLIDSSLRGSTIRFGIQVPILDDAIPHEDPLEIHVAPKSTFNETWLGFGCNYYYSWLFLEDEPAEPLVFTVLDDDNWEFAIHHEPPEERCVEPGISPGYGGLHIEWFEIEKKEETGEDDDYDFDVEINVDGTGKRGEDYIISTNRNITRNPGTGTFGPGLITGNVVSMLRNVSRLIIYVIPLWDGIYEEDETVTVTISGVYPSAPNRGPNHPGFQVEEPEDDSEAEIYQAPEFCSDVDAALKDPLPINDDFYKQTILKTAPIGTKTDTITDVHAKIPTNLDSSRHVKYSITGGNGQSYFRIDEDTGEITSKALLPSIAKLELEIEACDGTDPDSRDTAHVDIHIVDLQVRWEKNTSGAAAELGSNPNGGGLAIFPEKDAPNAAVKNKIDLKFEALPLNENRTIYYKILDPDNFIGLGKGETDAESWAGEDNYYNLGTNTLKSVVLPANQSSVTVTLTIESAHAGDNWIVVSDFDSDRVAAAQTGANKADRYEIQEVQGVKPARTKMLTVWRTLNVERDQVRSFMWQSEGNNLWEYSGIPDAGGIAEEQYSRACISVVTYDQEETSNTVDRLDIVEDPLHDGNQAKIRNARELSQPTKEFWTAHLVKAFWAYEDRKPAENWIGWAPYSQISNTAMVFKLAFETSVPADDIPVVMDRTIAHELGHLMGLDHPVGPGLMAAENENGQKLSVSEILDPANQKFTAKDLQKLQSLEKPR